MAVGGGLTGGGFERDGEVARVFFCEFRGCGKAEDVGGFVFAAEGLVELAEGGVAGEEDVDFAAEADGEAGAVEEAREGGGREARFAERGARSMVIMADPGIAGGYVFCDGGFLE